MSGRKPGAEALIKAGERLFSEHGPDVPLRDISRAAGNRNKSGVQYHFGDRDGLIGAIVEKRLEAVEEYGRPRLDELDGLSSYGLIEFLVNCLLFAAKTQESLHYMRFLETMRIFIKDWTETDTASWSYATSRLIELAPGATDEDRRRRVSALATAMFALLADCERNTETSDIDQVVPMLHALFNAEVAAAPSGRP